MQLFRRRFALCQSSKTTPKYRHHKASGQAVVTIQGRDHYLGPWKTKASKLEYDRLIGEWLSAGRPQAGASTQSNITTAELIAAYWKFAQKYYVKNGKPSGSIPGIKVALRILRQYYRHTRAIEFGPLALRSLQLRMVEAGQSRGGIHFIRVNESAHTHDRIVWIVDQSCTDDGLNRR
ncbi:MAG: hypothetical protein GY826_38875 [Fuerstiella sp.]|nr:hypothetical protein [Fuerstiella sp.]